MLGALNRLPAPPRRLRLRPRRHPARHRRRRHRGRTPGTDRLLRPDGVARPRRRRGGRPSGPRLRPGLQALDRSGWDADRLATLRQPDRPTARDGVHRLFPPAADRFFRAERLMVDGALESGTGVRRPCGALRRGGAGAGPAAPAPRCASPVAPACSSPTAPGPTGSPAPWRRSAACRPRRRRQVRRTGGSRGPQCVPRAPFGARVDSDGHRPGTQTAYLGISMTVDNYAGLRPEEAIAVALPDCCLPWFGWSAWSCTGSPPQARKRGPTPADITRGSRRIGLRLPSRVAGRGLSCR